MYVPVAQHRVHYDTACSTEFGTWFLTTFRRPAFRGRKSMGRPSPCVQSWAEPLIAFRSPSRPRLFPISGRASIPVVRSGDLIPDSSFVVNAFPADQLEDLNDHEPLYTTSADSDGLGTAGMPMQSDRPVQGAILHDADNNLSEIQLRLPRVFVAAKRPVTRGGFGSVLPIGGHWPNGHCQFRQFRAE
jgi:hypothetical protein